MLIAHVKESADVTHRVLKLMESDLLALHNGHHIDLPKLRITVCAVLKAANALFNVESPSSSCPRILCIWRSRNKRTFDQPAPPRSSNVDCHALCPPAACRSLPRHPRRLAGVHVAVSADV